MDLPLELQSDEFGELDTMQKDLICKMGALDLVLLENANELFRMFMQEGERNTNIEKIYRKISKENKNSIFLPSNTFEVKQNSKDNWVFSTTSENKKELQDYICECNKKVQKVTNDTIIFTTLGLDLGEGGHYGGLICDLGEETIFVFDSMSGEIEDGYMEGGLESIFKQLAKRLFIGDAAFSGLKVLKDKKLKLKAVKNNYFLQPTGGFEEFTAPILEPLVKKKSKLLKTINLQHTESQNHFCYIWSIWFVHIYLRGKMDLYQYISSKIKIENAQPLVVIKKYIYGLIKLLGGKLEYPRFFNSKFKQIWSNYENPLENKFELYEISMKIPKDIKECLDNSYDKLELKKIAKTSDLKVKNEICKKKKK